MLYPESLMESELAHSEILIEIGYRIHEHLGSCRTGKSRAQFTYTVSYTLIEYLAGIINARTRMILEQVDYSIKLSGFHKKLIAGITLTGGGAQLKNIKELCELITTTDTRIGVPNEHLSTDSVSYADLAHPMYATGIGLVLYGIEQSEAEHEDVVEEKAKATGQSNGKIDIFASMDMEPAEEPAPKAEEPAPEKPSKKEKKSKKDKGSENFEKTIGGFFKKLFDEGIDD